MKCQHFKQTVFISFYQSISELVIDRLEMKIKAFMHKCDELCDDVTYICQMQNAFSATVKIDVMGREKSNIIYLNSLVKTEWAELCVLREIVKIEMYFRFAKHLCVVYKNKK